MQTWVHAFFNDQRVQISLLIIVLDFVLGTIAAFLNKEQGFRLSYWSDTLRTDVLGKMVPFFVIYGGYLYAKNADLVIPGLDMEVLMNAAWGLFTLAVVGSILKSVSDLGVTLPSIVAGSDATTPTIPPNWEEPPPS